MLNRMPKFKIQKKHIAFFSIVPLLVVSALVKVDCPVCHGSGTVGAFQNMENVRITDVNWRESYYTQDICGFYFIYEYDVLLSLANDGDNTASGYIELVLVDLLEGKKVDKKYVGVEVPGRTSIDVSYTVWFHSYGVDTLLMRTKVRAQVAIDNVTDESCGGTGKVPLNSWPLINSLKESFKELGRTEIKYEQPLQFSPSDEQWVY